MSHTGRDTQQRNRSIKNTFQSLHDQARQPEQKTALSDLKEVTPGTVGPLVPINLPKPLVVHQLSKQLDASFLEHTLTGATGVRTKEEVSSYLEQFSSSRFPDTTRADFLKKKTSVVVPSTDYPSAGLRSGTGGLGGSPPRSTRALGAGGQIELGQAKTGSRNTMMAAGGPIKPPALTSF